MFATEFKETFILPYDLEYEYILTPEKVGVEKKYSIFTRQGRPEG